MISHLGRYEVVGEIGQGAMGVVYKAKDPLIDRIVAIKTINLDFAEDEKEEYEGRFYQEAKAAGRLSHQNIVTVFDVGRSGDIAYIAMEYLQGRELRDILNDERLPVEQSLDIVVQVAQGLAYAHEHNIIHRDVKPSNIMVVRDGHVKITDFGIARMESASVRTQTGMVLGSPKYMSPEQVTGKHLDQRSDVFSLGVMLYEMLTGQVPFAGENVNAIMYQIINTTPPPPSTLNPEVPSMLNFIVAKVLAKDVDNRYQSAKEFASDLRACRSMMLRSAAAEDTKLPKQLNAVSPVARTGADDEESKPVTMGLSSAFDSSGATMRLAAMTSSHQDTEELSRTLKRPVVSGDVLKQGAFDAARSRDKISPARIFEERSRSQTGNRKAVEPTGNSGNLLLIGIILLVLVGLVIAFIS